MNEHNILDLVIAKISFSTLPDKRCAARGHALAPCSTSTHGILAPTQHKMATLQEQVTSLTQQLEHLQQQRRNLQQRALLLEKRIDMATEQLLQEPGCRAVFEHPTMPTPVQLAPNGGKPVVLVEGRPSKVALDVHAVAEGSASLDSAAHVHKEYMRLVDGMSTLSIEHDQADDEEERRQIEQQLKEVCIVWCGCWLLYIDCCTQSHHAQPPTTTISNTCILPNWHLQQ